MMQDFSRYSLVFSCSIDTSFLVGMDQGCSLSEAKGDGLSGVPALATMILTPLVPWIERLKIPSEVQGKDSDNRCSDTSVAYFAREKAKSSACYNILDVASV